MSALRYRKDANSPWVEISFIKGDKGDVGETGPAGESGVYIGPTAPTGDENVWINPNGSASSIDMFYDDSETNLSEVAGEPVTTYQKAIEVLTSMIRPAGFKWYKNQGTDFESNKAWWDSLAASIDTLDKTDIVGATSFIYLNDSFLGIDANTPIPVVCIGADQDGENTLTFRTEQPLPTMVEYGDSVDYAQSNMKTYCDTFANICSASEALKTLTKTYTSAWNGKSTNAADKSVTVKAWTGSALEWGLESSNAFPSSDKEQTVGGDGATYAYHLNSEHRNIYKVVDNQSKVSKMATRSRVGTNNLAAYENWIIFNSSGRCASTGPANLFDVCPFFTVGKEE